MKKVISIAVLSLLVGCSPAPTATDNAGREKITLTEICLNGVVYYKGYVKAGYSYAPKFKPDSAVETCE
jgi:hypothetical protein